MANALRMGASGYLVKDASIDEVAAAIRAAADKAGSVSPEMAMAMLRETKRFARPTMADPIISPREEEVLQLVADGLSTPEVAEKLFISVKTVKNHLASIYEKLDTADRTQAVLRAVRMGIIRLD
jgi:two-component system, NarL family, response regulator DegU